MKYTARFVIYFAVLNYLSDDKKAEFNELLKTKFVKTSTQFKKILFQFFDCELILKKPFIWQDIWIYNHLKYEKNFSRSKLLNRYEREIIIPALKADPTLDEKFIEWGTYYMKEVKS